jgi:2-dehydropantoate 2-reductase
MILTTPFEDLSTSSYLTNFPSRVCYEPFAPFSGLRRIDHALCLVMSVTFIVSLSLLSQILGALTDRMTRVNGSIHILGAGAIGGLVAYELSTIPSPPKTILLWRNMARLEQFQSQYNSAIKVNRLFKTPVESVGVSFDSTIAENLKQPIENLIITTKTYQTQTALKPYLHLINRSTNILLIQNGLGVSDELFRDLWPNAEERPNVYQGVINHGAFVVSDPDEYIVAHAGFADLNIAKIPRDGDDDEVPLFIQQLIEAAGLVTKYMSYSDLLLIQLKKFTVNACINPITSILDCVNGELYSGDRMSELFHDIIDEAIDIFKACIPELKRNPRVNDVLDKEQLLQNAIHVGTVVNSQNSSSMRQDVLNSRQTEIDYINGYVVTIAEKHGLTANVNKTITDLVKLRVSINTNRNTKN